MAAPIKIDVGSGTDTVMELFGDNTITGATTFTKANGDTVASSLYSASSLYINSGQSLTISNDAEQGYCIKAENMISIQTNLNTNCYNALSGTSGYINSTVVDTSQNFASFYGGSFRVDAPANITSSTVDFIIAGSVDLLGGTISAKSSVTDHTGWQYAPAGIFSNDGTLIKNATIDLDGFTRGIGSYDDKVIINSGNITIKNVEQGIWSSGLAINGGTVSIAASEIAVKDHGSGITLGDNIGMTNENYFIGKVAKQLSDDYTDEYYTVYEGDCRSHTDALTVTFKEGATNKGDAEVPCPVEDTEKSEDSKEKSKNSSISAPDTGSAKNSNDDSYAILESLTFGLASILVVAYAVKKHHVNSKNRQKVYWK